MTFLGAMAQRGSLESTGRPLTDASLLSWMTGPKSAAGVNVSEERVLGLPAYYRALTVTAGALAALPVKTYQVGTRERIRRATVLETPNPRQTSIEWRTTTFLHLFAWGNAFSRKVRDGSGLVRQVWPVHPAGVRVELVNPTEQDPAGKLFIVRHRDGTEERLTSADMLHMPYMSMDGAEGVRPMVAFRQSLGLAIAGDDATASFFGNGSRLSGIIKTDNEMSDAGASRLKARWREMVGGTSRTGDIAVLDRGADFTPVSIPPVDAQLLESRKFAVSDIARIIGTPPHLVGDITNSTSWGTGIEQQVLGWVKFTLQTPISAAEARWTKELLPAGEYAEHSLEGLLRGDSKARAEFYRVLTDLSAISPAEIRDHENLTPVDGLDFYRYPSNMKVIRPGDDSSALDVMDLATMLQRTYLAVGKVISIEEARELANRAGAGLSDALPLSLVPEGAP